MRLLFIFIWNTLALIGLAVSALWRFPRFFSRRPPYVLFRFKGEISYRGENRAKWAFFRKKDDVQVSSIREFQMQCEALAKDARLKGIVLEVDDFSSSVAQRDMLVQAIVQFKSTGKEVIGYAIQLDTEGYEWLSACSRVLMAPAGRLELTGYAASALTIGRLLRMSGIHAEFIRRGSHKTAPELFTHEAVSDIQKQTLETLLEEKYQHLVQSLSRHRALTPDEVKAQIDQGPYSARRALQGKLIDAAMFRAELDQTLLGSEDETLLGYKDWARHHFVPPKQLKPLRKKPIVSVVAIRGMIVHGAGGRAPIGPKMAGSNALIEALREAAEDLSTQAILLHVDSPGGSAVASECLLEEVKRAQKKKPVIAYVDRVAASGGYMAALGAQELWSAPHAILGSIGVFAGKFDFSSVMNSFGIASTILVRGANAGVFSPYKPLSESEHRALEVDVEETYQTFLEMVATARKKTKEEVHGLGEGRVYSGARAFELGLADGLCNFEEAGRKALECANKASADFLMKWHTSTSQSLPVFSLFQQLQAQHLYALWEQGVTWESRP